MGKRTDLEIAQLTNDVRKAIYAGLNRFDIAKLTGIPVKTIDWYMNKVTSEDTIALAKYGEEVLFAEVAKTVGQYNEYIKELNGIMQEEESMPKDKIDAIKVKMDLATTKIGILSLGMKGNIKQIEEDAKKYSGNPKPIQEQSDSKSSRRRNKSDGKAKKVVLRKDKSDRKLLSKSSGRPSKAPGHNERTRNDAIPDSAAEPSTEEKGY